METTVRRRTIRCHQHLYGGKMIYDKYVWNKKTKVWQGPRGCVSKDGCVYSWVHTPDEPNAFQCGEEDSWEMAVWRAEHGQKDLDEEAPIV